MGLTSQPSLLTQAQFDDYTAAWQQASTSGPLPDLQALFQQTTRLLSATLPLDQLLHLVSAVGVRRIKVGFVVLPSAPQAESAFTLALYATDGAGKRLSAYYLASTPWSATPSSGAGPGGGTPVPPKLAELWQQQWTAAPAIETAFFHAPDGPLQGYDFEVRDFVDALLAVPQLSDKKLVFDFGLHELYGPDAPATSGLTRTFGLAMHLSDGHDLVASAIYDMAIPRPPAP